MLAVTSYDQDYVDACRARLAALLEAYRTLVAASREDGAAGAARALEAFEPPLFNQLVLALDACFLHRTRAIEGKDGNPLNEVRMLCAGILGGGTLSLDRTIKYRREQSVLGIAPGDEIRLDEPAFTRLASAFFDEIERRFVKEPVAV
jgi:hypothetical protein